MANGLLRELTEVEPRDTATLPTRDVRARRTPIVPALVRYETARRVARVVALGALDLLGVYLAIWTALALKVVLRGQSDLALTFDQTKDVAPLACLVTVLLF